jgi:hypothetical protein
MNWHFLLWKAWKNFKEIDSLKTHDAYITFIWQIPTSINIEKGISDKDTGIQYKLSTTETTLLTQQIGSQWHVASQILQKSEFSVFNLNV